ncbi:CoA transferase [Candidatus Bathyarchaeota archaeon]|nr:CoA transferase [Candidatus Bathyarchaeota archaeon]
MSGPLDGVRILDLTRLNPGGYSTMLLADMGAEVLKVEQPGVGDYMRYTPPMIGGQSAMFLTLNRNKRSLTLNLKSEKGKAILRRLLESYDVLVESFRPGVMERLGLDYQTLKEEHPRLIYCSITGYGQDGPYRGQAGHDINYLALSGVLSLTGKRDGPPIVPGITVADIAGSMFAVIGILISIISREKTGRGQYIDVSMFDGVVSWLTIQAARYFAEGRPPERETWPAGGEAFYDVFQTKDGGYVAVGAAEQKFWRNLCQGVGAPELAEWKVAVGQRSPIAHARLTEIFKTKTRGEWVSLLAGRDACLTPVKTLDEVFSDPHVLDRGLVFEMECLGSGPVKQLSFPIKLSDTRPETGTPPPMLGQHTEAVLNRLGYGPEQIEQLRREGVI